MAAVPDVPDRGSAQALATVLDSEGVPARIESSKLVAGIETRHCVLVPASLVHRAKWVLADTDLTDSELDTWPLESSRRPSRSSFGIPGDSDP